MGVLLVIVLGALLLGPKRLHAVFGHVGRAKAQFEKAIRTVKTQLEAELGARHRDSKADFSRVQEVSMEEIEAGPTGADYSVGA